MKNSNGQAEEREQCAEARADGASKQPPPDEYVVPVDPQEAVGCDDCQ